MVYCNEDCRKLYLYEKAIGKVKQFKIKQCENCNSDMKDNQKQRFCCKQCSLLFYRTEARNKKILEANSRDVPEEKKPNPALRNLSHTLEHSRLYDDFHIRRQIKGISRDLI
jgi:tRNA(Ile2) C34 agmatinyltransferase TiaS